MVPYVYLLGNCREVCPLSGTKQNCPGFCISCTVYHACKEHAQQTGDREYEEYLDFVAQNPHLLKK